MAVKTVVLAVIFVVFCVSSTQCACKVEEHVNAFDGSHGSGSNAVPIEEYPAFVGGKYVTEPDKKFTYPTPVDCAEKCEDDNLCVAWQMFYGSSVCEVFYGLIPLYEKSNAYVRGVKKT